MLASGVLASAACSGHSMSTDALSHVRGATYRLRAVNGALLPTRFAPMEDPQSAQPVRLESGQITFQADSRATGELNGAGELANVTRIFAGTYVEEGARVLIYANGDVAPDTAVVADDTITVRAQFFRLPSRERSVMVMTYTR